MKVSIKNLSVEMPVKNKGIEIEVRSTSGDHLGDLIVNKAGLIWCKGRTRRENGIRLTWQRFISLLENP
tara:strand:- start:79 stop:285 length:207 start_codon:yes stop_codon:yes gene_type:complete